MTLRSMLAVAACVLAAPVSAQAPHERLLLDGRILTAPAQVEGCDAPMVTENSATSLGLDFICRTPMDDQVEPAFVGVGVVLLTRPVVMKPRDFLIAQSESWWPDTTREERDARIVEKTRTVGDDTVDFLCIQRESEGAPASLVCVMQAEALQFMTSGRSASLAAAEQGMAAVLNDFRLRATHLTAQPSADPAPASAPEDAAAPTQD